jgi:transcriptional regulator with XRE-family HTH domain
MPNIDPTAKAWEETLSARVGATVQRLRTELGLTAVQLSERTRKLGYPITRVAITKIENNSRAGKLDVAEWIVLAYALDVPPGALLYPHLPDGPVEVLPGWVLPSWVALLSLDGEAKGVSMESLIDGFPQLVDLTRLTRRRLAKIEDRKAAWGMHNTEMGNARAENREPVTEVTEAALRSVAQIDRDVADLNQRMARIAGSVVENREGENDG